MTAAIVATTVFPEPTSPCKSLCMACGFAISSFISATTFSWACVNLNGRLAIKAFNNALQSYEKAIQINPKDANLWHEKGVILREVDRGNEAIRAFDKSIEINPDGPNAWYDKGVTLKGLGREEEATKCFQRVLELNPSHTMARHKLKQM